MTHASPKDFDFVETIVKESKSSFAAGMKVLPVERRGYLYAIYAYCRVLDDIADEDDLRENKLAELKNWRTKIDETLKGKPDCAITRILADGIKIYDLPTQELYNLIDGMEADANGPINKPTLEELYQYCRNVAVSVGLLSLPVFGRTDEGAKEFAIELGYALQLTNILRDIPEDESIGRIYLPSDLLEKHHVESLQSSELSKVLKEIAQLAQNHYDRTEILLKKIGSQNLLPAQMMKAGYYKIFEKMQKRGWHILSPRIRLSKTEKAFMVMRMLTKV
ncbi:putative phytoene synthase [Candidatus Terasakiella magnetica]|uniref:Putative phytoene synthase n=1 Tax=Candidatus Terasakiella magnetica TaxID=1867952 RepID=A0A1C3RCD6_9PROT|nr:squalene/phytoene synthase family protein [Candidatus Terasakiella magnetica]SCA54946.1 putative phytoene synthase [Candidatus Terasakiella magnetica]